MLFYYDYTYWMMLLPVLLITIYAQAKVSSNFNKYSRITNRRYLTGAQAAEAVLRQHGIYDVRIERVAGKLTDHYDPRTKTVNLSQSVFNSSSVAAIGVAAHECGHAIQDEESYAPLRIRSALVPVANFGTKAAIPIIILGLFFGSSYTLIQIGLLCFALGTLFQIVTLPVEFNASARAVRILGDSHMLMEEELQQTRKVLSAAALTYVAAALASVLSLLRLFLLFGGRDRD